MSDDLTKRREFWIYPFKPTNMLFVYEKPQKVKQEAPENFEEIHVIEYSAYNDIKAKYEKAVEALQKLSNCTEYIRDYRYKHIALRTLAKLSEKE